MVLRDASASKNFLSPIFVKRQIKLRREWFFSRCFFDDPIACKSLHNKSIKRNRPPAQGRVAADVETSKMLVLKIKFW